MLDGLLDWLEGWRVCRLGCLGRVTGIRRRSFPCWRVDITGGSPTRRRTPASQPLPHLLLRLLLAGHTASQRLPSGEATGTRRVDRRCLSWRGLGSAVGPWFRPPQGQRELLGFMSPGCSSLNRSAETARAARQGLAARVASFQCTCAFARCMASPAALGLPRWRQAPPWGSGGLGFALQLRPRMLALLGYLWHLVILASACRSYTAMLSERGPGPYRVSKGARAGARQRRCARLPQAGEYGSSGVCRRRWPAAVPHVWLAESAVKGKPLRAASAEVLSAWL